MTLHPHDFQRVIPVPAAGTKDWTGIDYAAVQDAPQAGGTWAGQIRDSGFAVTPEGATAPPKTSEDHHEWLSLLTAHDLSKDRFAMIEIGAGYGRWGMNAIQLCRMRNLLGQPRACQVMFVEPAENTMQMLRAHLWKNGVNPDDHLLRQEGLSWRPSERLSGHGFGTWLDDAGAASIAVRPIQAFVEEMPGIVDAIHMDVHGMEFETLTLETLTWLASTVRVMFIGTHGHSPGRSPADETALRVRLLATGWDILQFAHADHFQQTPFGNWRTCDGFCMAVSKGLV